MPFPAGNSEEDGQLLFKWLIHPTTEKHFFKYYIILENIWELDSLLVILDNIFLVPFGKNDL